MHLDTAYKSNLSPQRVAVRAPACNGPSLVSVSKTSPSPCRQRSPPRRNVVTAKTKPRLLWDALSKVTTCHRISLKLIRSHHILSKFTTSQHNSPHLATSDHNSSHFTSSHHISLYLTKSHRISSHLTASHHNS